jgi:hypothetical protein
MHTQKKNLNTSGVPPAPAWHPRFSGDKGATYLVLHQGGCDMKAPRTSDKVAVVERKEIAVSPKILALYTGTYELQPRFDLVITLEGDQLFVVGASLTSLGSMAACAAFHCRRA